MGIKGPSLMELRLNYYLLRVDKRHVFTLVFKKNVTCRVSYKQINETLSLLGKVILFPLGSLHFFCLAMEVKQSSVAILETAEKLVPLFLQQEEDPPAGAPCSQE